MPTDDERLARYAQLLAPPLLASAARLLTDAFFTNPVHVYLCPDAARRRGQLEWMLGGNLRQQPDLRRSFCLVEGGEVAAMGFWTRTDAPEAGLLRRLRAGLPLAPFKLGLVGLRRVSEVTAAFHRQIEGALAGEAAFMLNNMAVREDLRGTGVGTALLRAQLRRLSDESPGACLTLATQRPENVVFYGRLGFETASEQTIGAGPDAFTNWIMTGRANEVSQESPRPV